MEKLLLTLSLAVFSLGLFAQSQDETRLFYTSNNPVLLQSYIQNAIQQEGGTTPTVSLGSPNTWLHDSTYAYTGIGDTWNLASRTMVVARNTENLWLSSLVHFHDPVNGWYERDSLVTRYYPDGVRDEYFSMPWNSTTNNWEVVPGEYQNFYPTGEQEEYRLRIWNYNTNEYGFGVRIKYIRVNNQLSETIRYDWEFASSSWINSYRETYIHDTDGKLLELVAQLWDNDQDEWISNYRETFNYQNDLLISKIEHSNDNGWVYERRINYDYEGNLLKNLTEERWDAVLFEWKDYSREAYTYSPGGNLIYVLRESWVPTNGIWINDNEENYNYNINNEITYHLGKEWDTDVNDWVNVKEETFSYNSIGELGEYERIVWDTDTDAWDNDLKEVYFWNQLTVSTEDLEKEIFSVSPNPASNFIRIQGEQNNIQKIQCLNLSGQIINEWESTQTEITLNLNSGIYFIRILGSDNKIYTKKLIVL